MIEIQINGEKRIFGEALTLHELIRLLNIDETSLAVAVNDSVIARSLFKEMKISPGDRIEIVRPLGGG